MNNKQFGKELEQGVCNLFNQIGIKAYLTKGSGNKGQAGDIQQDIFVVECKNRNTKDITLKKDVWDKLKHEIPLQSSRLPLYILRNKSNDTYAVLDINDFFRILEGYLIYKGVINV